MRTLPSSSYFCSRSGQSLIELLIAMAIGTIMVIAAGTLIAPALKSHQSVSRIQIAAALGKELLDNTRVFAETDWHNLANLSADGTAYFIDGHGAYIRAVTGTEGVLTDNITNGLIAYWKFDESVGTTTYDISGNRYDGTMMDGALRTGGYIGSAFSGDGINDRVHAPTGTPFIYTGGDLSASLWFNASTEETSTLAAHLLSKPWTNTLFNWRIQVLNTSTAGVRFTLAGTSTQTWTGTTVTTTRGVWHHVVMVLQSSSRAVMYLDGALKGDWAHTVTNWDATNNNRTLIIAASYDTASGWAGNADTTYYGLVDDVRIYNRALAANEVEKIYKGNLFTRSFSVSSACRDTAGALGSCGTSDPSTRQITVSFGPAGFTPSTMATYLTRVRNYVFSQTDWSGGGSFSGPYSTTTNRYANATSTNTTSTSGSIVINGI